LQKPQLTWENENEKTEKKWERKQRQNKRRESRKLLFELREIDRYRLSEDPTTVASSLLQSPAGMPLVFTFVSENKTRPDIKGYILFFSLYLIKYMFCTKGLVSYYLPLLKATETCLWIYFFLYFLFVPFSLYVLL
jgi:hypothetical protein